MRDVMLAWKNASELGFNYVRSDTHINLPEVPLPKVKSCRVDFYQMPEDAYIHLWRQVLRICPRLKFAYLRILCLLQSLDMIEELLSEMQQHGVTQVCLSFFILGANMTERVGRLRQGINGWMRVRVEINCNKWRLFSFNS